MELYPWRSTADALTRALVGIAPLYRLIVGFDRMLPALRSVMQPRAAAEWLPFDIVARGADSYRITMAVPGFTKAGLSFTRAPNLLLIAGGKPAAEASGGRYLYRGMPAASFERRFELADHVSAVNARLAGGLLTIALKREVPEGAKPRRVAISSGVEATQAAQPQLETERIDSDRRAA